MPLVIRFLGPRPGPRRDEKIRHAAKARHMHRDLGDRRQDNEGG